jgi:hypothetical protein
MLCRQQLSDSGTRDCRQCGLRICVRCWSKNPHCPNCKVAWPRAAQDSA